MFYFLNAVIHDPQVDQFSYSRDNSLCSAIIGTETADNGLYTCNESNQSSSEKGTTEMMSTDLLRM